MPVCSPFLSNVRKRTTGAGSDTRQELRLLLDTRRPPSGTGGRPFDASAGELVSRPGLRVCGPHAFRTAFQPVGRAKTRPRVPSRRCLQSGHPVLAAGSSLAVSKSADPGGNVHRFGRFAIVDASRFFSRSSTLAATVLIIRSVDLIAFQALGRYSNNGECCLAARCEAGSFEIVTLGVVEF